MIRARVRIQGSSVCPTCTQVRGCKMVFIGKRLRRQWFEESFAKATHPCRHPYPLPARVGEEAVAPEVYCRRFKHGDVPPPSGKPSPILSFLGGEHQKVQQD